MDTKLCGHCKQTLPIKLFQRNSGLSSWCKPCDAEYARNKRKLLAEDAWNPQTRTYKLTVCQVCGDAIRATPRARLCVACRRDYNNERVKIRFKQNFASGSCYCGRPRVEGRTKCEKCIACNIKNAPRYLSQKRTQGAEYRKDIKRRVFEHYGLKCSCCGESIYEFLSIEHTGGWGKDHKKENGKRYAGLPLYIWLIKNDFPKDGFETHCFNCNQSKGYYGYCPHQSTERDAPPSQA